jgi:REP element-mobilizing transposase RayT
MTAYRRYRVKGGCYFFTVALAERRGSLLTENVEGLRAAFREVKQAHPFEMKASVILPDHLHCSWTLPEGDDDFSTRWRQSKAAFSRRLPKIERRSESRLNKGERGYGSGGFGSMRYGMIRIFSAMSITPTGMSRGWRTGNFHHFIASCRTDRLNRFG